MMSPIAALTQSQWLPRIGGTLLGNLVMAAGKTMSWASSTILSAPADGAMRLANAANSIAYLFKVQANALAVRTGDDSSYGLLECQRLTLGPTFTSTVTCIDPTYLYLPNNGVVKWQSTVQISQGTGSPEGVVTAPVGSLFLRADGGVSTTLYVKQSGTGNTGWAAK